ncbi:hypothetical protein I5M27_01680 [Adhaeribacter sp. BT258]|uniref:Lipoprotein n=1 Tax=Adhaeribacter terrigena TaxID=2793070 RepID=A0ABS1BZI4_9BACT|nr:hypothetical protein [Adhaeribacter terrigena]MBK0401675.1 hypothetical protein [Adhaeribacter terrigena]
MKIRYLFFLLPALLLACEGSDQIENRSQDQESTAAKSPPGHDEIDGRDTIRAKAQSEFVTFFTQFQTAVYNEDADAFNHFMDSERGVYIIENPGAMPKMTLVKDIRNFKRDFQQQSFFTIKDGLQSCKLKEETLPTFNCEGQTGGNTGYSKEGCFVADAEAFRKTEMHKYASLPENELKNIEKTLPLVQKTVVQTATSYQFHFGQINGKWKVLFIDLRIPCSA